MDGNGRQAESALDTTGLPIDLVIVSDHGMVKVEGPMDRLSTNSPTSPASTPLALCSTARPKRIASASTTSSRKLPAVRRLSTQNVPAGLNYNQNPREGDPVVIATGPYAIRAHAPAAGAPSHPPTIGMHGFDPHLIPEMKAIFVAAGPDLIAGKTVAPFENVNLYPWLAHMLGLHPPKSDGSLNILSGTLRDHGVAAESAPESK
jgi:predicted AlkP superfamily pyrophosphatase or phosphodiesterase